MQILHSIFFFFRSMFPLPRSLPQFLSFPVEASQSDTWSQAGDLAGLSSTTGIMSLMRRWGKDSSAWAKGSLAPTPSSRVLCLPSWPPHPSPSLSPPSTLSRGMLRQPTENWRLFLAWCLSCLRWVLQNIHLQKTPLSQLKSFKVGFTFLSLFYFIKCFCVAGCNVHDGPCGHVPLSPVQVRPGVHRRPGVRAECLLPPWQVLQLPQLHQAGAHRPYRPARGSLWEDVGVLPEVLQGCLRMVYYL